MVLGSVKTARPAPAGVRSARRELCAAV